MVKILALTGLMGAGKDVVAEYIEKKYNYRIVQVADMLRSMARARGLDTNRETLQKLRKEYGKTFLAEEAVRLIKQGQEKNTVYVPLRVWEDYTIPKKEFGKDFFLIHVQATPQVRFAHLKERKRDTDPQTFAEFERQEQSEIELFDFEKLFAHADVVITNNGSFNELHKQIDALMERLQ
ncbi:MAG: AAA family ATPase [Candidatus Aenigmarchaeota archaeon]|nr:AAA family ATPase [Candidatus Aenigmarchaeota archaeon]